MEVFNNEQFGSVRIIEEPVLRFGRCRCTGVCKAQKRYHRPLPVRQSNKQRSDILCKQIPKGGQT